MAIAVRTEGNVSIVQLSGEFTLGHEGLARPLDLHGHRLEDLGETLRGLLDRGASRVVLDLEKVRFIDSAGLGDLIKWKKRALQLGGDVRAPLWAVPGGAGGAAGARQGEVSARPVPASRNSGGIRHFAGLDVLERRKRQRIQCLAE